MSWNKLQTIPQNFKNLEKLEVLDLAVNPLTTLPDIFENMFGLRRMIGPIHRLRCRYARHGRLSFSIFEGLSLSLPDSIRFVNSMYLNISDARLVAMVHLKYERWYDRKPLLLMKPDEVADPTKCAAMYEVLFGRVDGQNGTCTTSGSDLV